MSRMIRVFDGSFGRDGCRGYVASGFVRRASLGGAWDGADGGARYIEVRLSVGGDSLTTRVGWPDGTDPQVVVDGWVEDVFGPLAPSWCP